MGGHLILFIAQTGEPLLPTALHLETLLLARQPGWWPRMKYRIRLQRQLVPGQVLRLQFSRPLYVENCGGDCLSRQPIYEVNINVVETRPTSLCYRALNITNLVYAAESRERLRVETLSAD